MTVQCEKVGLDFVDDAKHRFVASEVIAATPERVFDVFEDAELWTKWAPPITDVEWTSPFPLEAGSTRNVTMMGGMVGYEEFLIYDRGTHMAFRFNETNKPMAEAFAEDYRVTRVGNDKCEVTWTMAMQPSGFSTRTMPLTAPIMGFGLKVMLRRFRKYVESNPTLAND